MAARDCYCRLPHCRCDCGYHQSAPLPYLPSRQPWPRPPATIQYGSSTRQQLEELSQLVVSVRDRGGLVLGRGRGRVQEIERERMRAGDLHEWDEQETDG